MTQNSQRFSPLIVKGNPHVIIPFISGKFIPIILFNMRNIILQRSDNDSQLI